MFNETSGLVIIWVKNIRSSEVLLEQVPVLSNLKEVVTSVVNT